MATEIHPADDFTDGTEGSGGGGGAVSLVATAPLTFDAMTSTLAVMPAGAGSAGIVTTGAQTIAGAKTFSSAVSCAVAPSDSAHLANKGYINGLVSMGVHWLANVNKTYNLASGDPPGLADGKRYIATFGVFPGCPIGQKSSRMGYRRHQKPHELISFSTVCGI